MGAVANLREPKVNSSFLAQQSCVRGYSLRTAGASNCLKRVPNLNFYNKHPNLCQWKRIQILFKKYCIGALKKCICRIQAWARF